jgi:hypothetical protein
MGCGAVVVCGMLCARLQCTRHAGTPTDPVAIRSGCTQLSLPAVCADDAVCGCGACACVGASKARGGRSKQPLVGCGMEGVMCYSWCAGRGCRRARRSGHVSMCGLASEGSCVLQHTVSEVAGCSRWHCCGMQRCHAEAASYWPGRGLCERRRDRAVAVLHAACDQASERGAGDNRGLR